MNIRSPSVKDHRRLGGGLALLPVSPPRRPLGVRNAANLGRFAATLFTLLLACVACGHELTPAERTELRILRNEHETQLSAYQILNGSATRSNDLADRALVIQKRLMAIEKRMRALGEEPVDAMTAPSVR